MEKAWAKMKGYYSATSGGFVEEGIRAFLGCPIFSYKTSGQNALIVWNFMKDADTKNYVLGVGTDGSSDTTYNSCNIPMAHAYAVISVFQMTDGSSHRMYMIRNPWGTSEYNGNWRSSDPAWTSSLKSQVPHGVDPTTS